MHLPPGGKSGYVSAETEALQAPIFAVSLAHDMSG